VVIAIVLSVVAVLAGVRRDMRAMQDGRQLREIWSVSLSAGTLSGSGFPLPSRAAFRHDANDPVPEDFTVNHSANIYSMLVMEEYVSPRTLVSPVEVLGHVTPFDPDYGRYSPADGIYWDDRFVMHIHDPAVGANGSYAHLVAVGERRHLTRQATAMPLFGNRAPGPAPGAQKRSPTLRFYRPHDVWVGNIVFTDGRIDMVENYYPAGVAAPDDNIYAADREHPMGPHAAADAFLAVYISATEFTVEDVYDPLDPE
jgi:hypothetical protein